MSGVVVGYGLAHNNSSFILVQANYAPRPVGGRSDVYCLSLGALESVGSYKFTSERWVSSRKTSESVVLCGGPSLL